MALITEWTTPLEQAVTGVVSAQKINEQVLQNLLYLLNKPYDEVQYGGGVAADWTFTNTALATIDTDRFKVEVDTESGNVQMNITLQLLIPSNAYVRGGILIDDDWYYGHPDGAGGAGDYYVYSDYARDVDHYKTWNATYNIFGLGAGIHSFAPHVLVTSGTGTVYYNSSDRMNIVSARVL